MTPDSAGYVQVLLPLRLDWAPYYSVPEGMQVRRGSRVRVKFAGREYSGVVLGTPSPQRPEGIKAILGIEGPEPLADISAQELDFWKFVAEYYLCTEGEVYRMAYPATATRQELLRAARKAKAEAAPPKKSSRKKAAAAEEALQGDEAPGGGKNVQLTAAQMTACGGIQAAFKAGKPALLQGVTGSGKTEIYIALAKETLASGRNVLMLVPEIALEKQLEDRIAEYFGPKLLTFHSGETAVHRAKVIEALRSRDTEGYFLLGTRSALFLPHCNLGLVIVDEEHDSSYKQQDPAPRYNGRDCAAVLALQHKARLLLGSATPSLESLYNVDSGRYSKVGLNEKYYGGSEPQTVIIDTSAERKKNGMVGSFSRKLIALIEGRLSKGEQVLLLRARRAYATAMQCSECGEIAKCPRCNVPLSYHKDSNTLECHYCGFREPLRPCAKCGGVLQGIGSGTQKIEEEAAALFPQARIARLDSDATPLQRAEIVKDFAEGRTDILVGTQILTKGLDFPDLTLVAAIGTDALLGRMDFRADEKAVQLLSQFRGRAGRRSGGGMLAIQTAQKEHPVFRMMEGGMSGSTLDENILAERKTFGFPPFCRMINVNIKDSNEARLEVLSRALMKEISETIPGAVGPYSPQIDKISNNFLKTIRLNLPRDKKTPAIKARLYGIIRKFEESRKWQGHTGIDVDPS